MQQIYMIEEQQTPKYQSQLKTASSLNISENPATPIRFKSWIIMKFMKQKLKTTQKKGEADLTFQVTQISWGIRDSSPEFLKG